MGLTMPTPEQAFWGLRTMKSVAMADGAMDHSERHMPDSIRRTMGATIAEARAGFFESE